MSKATYWQRGESLDYYNDGTDVIEANTIIELGSHIGVAGADILPEDTGSVHMTGVYAIPKSDTDAIEFGTPVYYDGSGISATGTDIIGYAAEDSEADADVILVKLQG